MASLYNLKRNSRVFFTTNLSTAGAAVAASGFLATNTQELSVLDGFTFTQTTTAQAITLNEAGSTPTRGQRSFNTALNPVDFSFSTYIRPNFNLIQTNNVDCDEADLWNALFGVTATSDTGLPITYTGTMAATYDTATGKLTATATTITAGTALTVGDIYTISGLTGAGASQFNAPVSIVSTAANNFVLQYLTAPVATATVPTGTQWVSGTTALQKKSWIANPAQAADSTTLGTTAAYAEVSAARSNSNTLLPFGMIIIADGITYTIDNCALDQASIDFGLDGIATVAWTGKGTQLNQLTTVITATNGGSTAAPTVTLAGALTGTAAGKSATTTRYITNKLSTATIVSNIGGAGTAYTLALTGGSIQIANNLNYLTPTNLGVVNVPIGYYTGTRAITGTINAYLKTGGGSTKTTGDLLQTVLSSSTSGTTEQKYQLNMSIGGSGNPIKVELLVNGCSLQVPTVDASQDVISTAIQFTAQGADAIQGVSTANYDVGAVNDLRIRYFTN